MASTPVLAHLDISLLIPHEHIDAEHLMVLQRQVARDGAIHTPVLIDRDTGTILDGHHRVEVARRLGITKVPALLVDYMDDNSILVDSWKENVFLTKLDVISAARSGVKLPPKTSKHMVAHKIQVEAVN